MASVAASLPGQEEDQIFYNVLPEEKSGGPLVNADNQDGQTPIASVKPAKETVKLEPAATLPAAVTSATVTKPKAHRGNTRLIILSVILALLLGVGGFLGYQWWNSRSANEVAPTNVLVPPEQQLPESKDVTTPPEWLKRYFGVETCAEINICGDESDPDRDGLKNLEEFNQGTDPNNADSSGGGLADGDKVHIFGGDPLKSHSRNQQYSDADYVKYGYDLTTDQPYTPEKLAEIKLKIKQLGLHQPTINTIGEEGWKLYEFSSPETESKEPELDSSIDQSPTAKLDRDTQRATTIKKVGGALLKYKAERKAYPETTEFSQLVESVKPYILVATNFQDPINKDKYVYGYVPGNRNQDFTLTYYSETQNMLIKYRAQDAEIEATKTSSAALDDQRKRDLESLRIALLLYSGRQIDANSEVAYAFPPADKYKTLLVPEFITVIPKDPRTAKDYPYTVSEKFDSFTIKATLDNPTPGTTGWMCNQDECSSF
jgi:hypothetical protein